MESEKSSNRWFDWSVFALFVVFFGTAWLVMQGLHWYVDLESFKISPPGKNGAQLHYAHYWLSQWFLIILTSYLVSLLTIFIGNTIDLKNRNKDRVDLTQWPTSFKEWRDWLLSKLKPPSKSYDLAVFTLAVGVLIAVAVLVVSEACKLTVLSLDNTLSANSNPFGTAFLVVRQMALHVSGLTARDVVGTAGGETFVWHYLWSLTGVFLVLFVLCVLAGIRIVRAANEVEVTWEADAKGAATSWRSTWEAISKRLSVAIKQAEGLVLLLGAKARDLNGAIEANSSSQDAVKIRVDRLRALTDAANAAYGELIPTQSEPVVLGLADLDRIAKSILTTMPDEAALGTLRANLNEYVATVEAAIATQAARQHPDRTAEQNATDSAKTHGNGLPNKLAQLCRDAIELAGVLIAEAEAQLAELVKTARVLAAQAEGHDAALKSLSAPGKASPPEAVGGKVEDGNAAPLLSNLEFGAPHILAHQNKYIRIEKGADSLEFKQGRLHVGENEEIVLVAGTYKTQPTLEKDKINYVKFAFWAFVFIALALNNFIVAPEIEKHEALKFVAPIFSQIGTVAFVSVAFLLPFILVTAFPPFLVYTAAQNVLPGNDEANYGHKVWTGIRRFLFSGALGILVIVLISYSGIRFGYGYGIFIEKPVTTVTADPAADIAIHPVPVYCAMTKVTSADGKQINWVYANNDRIEADAADCRLLDNVSQANYIVVVGTASQEELRPTDDKNSEDRRSYDRANALAGALKETLPENWDGKLYVLSLGRHPGPADSNTAVANLALANADQRQTLVLIGRAETPPSLTKVKAMLNDYFSDKIEYPSGNKLKAVIDADEFCSTSCWTQAYTGGDPDPSYGEQCRFTGFQYKSSEAQCKTLLPSTPQK